MQLFILIPTIKDQELWGMSEYLGEVIVRADSAETARLMAAEEYWLSQNRRSSELNNPWKDDSEVSCEPYVGADYTRQGQAEILYPTPLRP